MSALRNAHLPPDRMFTDIRPNDAPAPLRGFSHHGSSVTGGSFCRPLPVPEPTVARRAQLAEAAARYRARRVATA